MRPRARTSKDLFIRLSTIAAVNHHSKQQIIWQAKLAYGTHIVDTPRDQSAVKRDGRLYTTIALKGVLSPTLSATPASRATAMPAPASWITRRLRFGGRRCLAGRAA